MSETAGPVAIVQFPHPGAEHEPGDVRREAWNTGSHRRKFLISPGRYVDGNGERHATDLVFWGEWEAPSIVESRWEADGRLPRYLHRPLWARPHDGEPRQNTDPWVFGERFRYSNCRQLTPRGRPSALQSLPTGSVILFGSKLDGAFVLDTVFVVRDAVPYVPRESSHLELEEAFRVCMVDSLTLSGSGDEAFTLHSGATPDDPVNGAFSFAPARLADDPDRRFTRPAIWLPGFVNPANARAASGGGTRVEPSVALEQWRRVRDQVLAAGCVLGTEFETPALSEE